MSGLQINAGHRVDLICAELLLKKKSAALNMSGAYPQDRRNTPELILLRNRHRSQTLSQSFRLGMGNPAHADEPVGYFR